MCVCVCVCVRLVHVEGTGFSVLILGEGLLQNNCYLRKGRTAAREVVGQTFNYYT